jgi:GGDEF domain-containing protein
MKRIRIRVIVLASWLVFIFYINRLLEPVAISSAAIALVFLMATATLLMPRKPVMLVWVIMLLPIFALFFIKVWTGQLLADLGVMLAVIETFMIVFTTILASWVSAGLSEVEASVAQVALGGPQEKTHELAQTGLGVIYREVRRARNHHRPLALISIGVEEKSIDMAVEKMVQEIQLSMVRQYKLQRLSALLCDQLEDCAIVARDADRFLAVLPETAPDELPFVMERLRQKAFSQISLELKIGAATLPEDSYTFEGLLDKATLEMEAEKEPRPFVVLDQQPVERNIN